MNVTFSTKDIDTQSADRDRESAIGRTVEVGLIPDDVRSFPNGQRNAQSFPSPAT